MNQQEEMQLAIEEYLGWFEEDNESTICWTRKDLTYCVPKSELPDFYNDLNAMHEAEKVLTYEQLEAMHQTLADVLSTWKPRNRGTAHDFMWHATAAQRAEAFCRTLKIGPFKEQPK